MQKNPTTFPVTIQNWLNNLSRLNIQIEDICYENFLNLDDHAFVHLSLEDWENVKKVLNMDSPITIQAKNEGYLVGYLLSHQNSMAYLGLFIRSTMNDSTLEIIRTSLGWLFYENQVSKLEQAWHAEQLLEIFTYVINQPKFQIAAQEWINRTTTYIRHKYPDYKNIQISYFLVKDVKKIQWVVSSELAWTEKGAMDMQAINEVALQAIFLQHEIKQQDLWAYPILQHGKIQGILAVKDQTLLTEEPPKLLSEYLKNNVDLIHPVLLFWSLSEQNFFQNTKKSFNNFLSKYTSNGHYAWKILTTLFIVVLLCITCIPVDKLVTANLNVEGKTRWIISAPTQGFIQEVLVRPGDKVQKDQLLMKLDDTELKLQAAEQQSLLDQAQHQFRNAMAEQNLTESGLAANQIQQQETKVDTLKRKLKQTQITAPLNGTIINGDWVQQIGTPLEDGKEIFQIASQDAYKVILHVADKNISLVKNQQDGLLKLTSLPDQHFPFKIIRISPVASVENNINGFKVEAEWIDSPPALTPGMQGVGKITVGKTNLLSRWSHDFINWLKLKLWSTW